MFKNIILTGFMGVGKTSVGTRLAKDLGYVFIDTDELIEADQKITITEIFSNFGEPYFRDVETRVIRQILENEGQVIATGGGAVIRDENRRSFKENGGNHLPHCPSGKHLCADQAREAPAAVAGGDPLAKIRELLDARDRFYRQADFVIDTSSGPWTT